MSRPTVYLAGPIMGCTEREAKNWRQAVADILSLHGITGVSPLRCEPIVGEVYAPQYVADPKFGTAQAIFAKNMMDTRRCDMVLAYLPSHSFGTMVELAWARAFEKPVILVSELPSILSHPVLTQCAGWILPTLDDAVDVILGVLSAYAIGGKSI